MHKYITKDREKTRLEAIEREEQEENERNRRRYEARQDFASALGAYGVPLTVDQAIELFRAYDEYQAVMNEVDSP